MAITKEIIIDVETGEAVQSVNKLNKSVEQVEKSSADVQKQNEATKKSFKGLTVGVKALGTALKAAGIGLIVAALAKVGELLSENQVIVDKVNTVWTALGTVVKDTWNALMNFDETLSTIGETIKNLIVERFTSALKAVNGFGSALVALMKGEFKLAGELAKESLEEIILPGPELTKVINGFKDYTSEVYNTAEAYVELANQAKIAEAQQRGIFEQYDRDAEIQRRIRDDFELTAEQRLAANEELKRILDEQEKVQLRLGQISVNAAQKEIELKGRTTERVVALIEAQNELLAIEADIAGRRAEQEAQDRALRKELLDARQAEIGNVIETENLKVSVLDDSIQRQAEARLRGLETERQISEASKKIAEEEAKAKQELLNNTAQALTNLSLIAGQETGAGKALAIAASLINTYAAIAGNLKAFSGVPIPGYAIAQAIATGAAGFAAVKNIIDTKVPNEKGGNPQSGGNISGGGGVAAPSFNVVGTSGVNQLAETLNQDQEPVQAFVVGSEVTTQQALDRNIVNTATLG